MRMTVVVMAALIAFPMGASADVTCTGAAGNTFSLDAQLDWCSTNHGFNEGAVCGLNALGGTGISGLPAIASGTVLGNTWDRTNMMGATKAANNAGQKDAAVAAAICCQIHNPDAHACLANNRNAVQAWLDSHR